LRVGADRRRPLAHRLDREVAAAVEAAERKLFAEFGLPYEPGRYEVVVAVNVRWSFVGGDLLVWLGGDGEGPSRWGVSWDREWIAGPGDVKQVRFADEFGNVGLRVWDRDDREGGGRGGKFVVLSGAMEAR
jgi:hypothetical protein